MFADLTSADLAECLSSVEEVNLKGLELLRQLRPVTGQWFPQVPAEVLAEATSQIVAYTRACSTAASKLQSLPPIILPDLPCAEFCL